MSISDDDIQRNRADLEGTVTALIAQHFDVAVTGDITDDTHIINDLGGESSRHFGFITAVEKAFNVEFFPSDPDEEIPDRTEIVPPLNTRAQIVAAVQNELKLNPQ